MNPVSHRTVLLATDSSHSIICEIVDGKTNAIAYSAYGDQSAQQEVATRLGFNGLLREANIDWYLLGKGYRAYNPRLMRFHSPDSWSPFGGGGLNAYMYCVGDPVNRSDPTGHIGDLILLGIHELKKVAAFGKSADEIASRNVLRRAAALKRQAAMSALTANTGRSFPSDNPGSITNALSGAFFEVSIGPSFKGSPPTPNSPHVHPNGVDPNKVSLSYGFMYGGVISSGTGNINSSGVTSIGRHSSIRPNTRRSSAHSLREAVVAPERAIPMEHVSHQRSGAPVVRNPVVDVAHPVHVIRQPAVPPPPPLIVVVPPPWVPG